jgi:hypothetical protein
VRLAFSLAAFALACLVVWLVAFRSLSLLIDRVSTLAVKVEPVRRLSYENGVFEVAGLRLYTLTTETLPSGLGVTIGPSGRAVLEYDGRSFPCGPGSSSATPSGFPHLTFDPDPRDTVTITFERSRMSWPTPLEMNFMTGSAPSWKRHLYWRLNWTKRSGAQAEILWRFEQGYFRTDGWRPAAVDIVPAGLLHANITEATDLHEAATKYLTSVKHWERSTYRLEDHGPAEDGSGEIVAAIHREDESTSQPGSGLSVQLLLDYRSRRVTRELAFQ